MINRIESANANTSKKFEFATVQCSNCKAFHLDWIGHLCDNCQTEGLTVKKNKYDYMAELEGLTPAKPKPKPMLLPLKQATPFKPVVIKRVRVQRKSRMSSRSM